MTGEKIPTQTIIHFQLNLSLTCFQKHVFAFSHSPLLLFSQAPTQIAPKPRARC